MSRRASRTVVAVVLALVVGLLPQAAGAELPGLDPAGAELPGLDLAGAEPTGLQSPVPIGPCTVEDEYEARIYDLEIGDDRYGDQCERFRFMFGPIVVKPGENDALIEPVTIEKPTYDGYIVRFRPDLVRAATGEAPPTEDMHLHHATWLNAYPSYGSGPFFAAGEEKTVATFPEGYGLPVGATDTWLLLYMVHNDIVEPDVVWLTYDIDYIAAGDGEELGIAPIRNIWLDVQRSRIHPDAPSTSANPVFNVQRGFVPEDHESGVGPCSASMPPVGTTRIAAGGPASDDVIKCQLKPIDPADYAAALNDEQLAELAEVFPDGVCDWSQPSVGDVAASILWPSLGGASPRLDDAGEPAPVGLVWRTARSR